jgi:hypothetical protein
VTRWRCAIGLLGLLALGPMARAQDVPSLPAAVRSTRPPAEDGAPTQVRVGFYLVDVFSIDDAEESFSADFVFMLRWRDPRLVDPGLGLAGTEVQREAVWSPVVQVVNDVDVRFLLPEVLQIDAEGGVSYRQRCKGAFSSELDLRRFPMDSQELTVDLVVLEHTEDEVRLVPDAQWSGGRDDISTAGWEIGLGTLESTSEYFAAQDRHMSRVSQHVSVRRNVSYYYYKVFLPLTLIVFMAWAVFWMDPANVGPQVGVSTAAIFTLIAFQLGLSSSLPRVAYLTSADQFILGCTLLVFAALGEAVVASYMVRMGRGKQALRVDRVARAVYPVAFLGIATFTLWTA